MREECAWSCSPVGSWGALPDESGAGEPGPSLLPLPLKIHSSFLLPHPLDFQEHLQSPLEDGPCPMPPLVTACIWIAFAAGSLLLAYSSQPPFTSLTVLSELCQQRPIICLSREICLLPTPLHVAVRGIFPTHAFWPPWAAGDDQWTQMWITAWLARGRYGAQWCGHVPPRATTALQRLASATPAWGLAHALQPTHDYQVTASHRQKESSVQEHEDGHTQSPASETRRWGQCP